MARDHRQGSTFQRFQQSFAPTAVTTGPFPEWSSSETRSLLGRDLDVFTMFLQTSARASFEDGVLRFLTPTKLVSWNAPDAWKISWGSRRAERLSVFATDWLGRQLALDHDRERDGEPLVTLLDVATGVLSELPCTFAPFLNDALVDERDTILAFSLYRTWRAAGHPRPGDNECIGYDLPLSVGGESTFANMSVTEMGLYVDLSGQVLEQTEGAPDGARISGYRTIALRKDKG